MSKNLIGLDFLEKFGYEDYMSFAFYNPYTQTQTFKFYSMLWRNHYKQKAIYIPFKLGNICNRIEIKTYS